MDPEVKYTAQKVKIEKILLDPNNLRLHGITRTTEVPLNRVADESIQDSVLEEMKKIADLKPLKESILEVGFLPILGTRIVVREINGKYLTMEGNRRIASIKWILQDYERGELPLSEDKIPLIENLKELDVIVAEGSPQDLVNLQFLIQGITHISGPKEWGPYQKAFAAVKLKEERGMEVPEIARALGGGLTTRAVNTMIRAFKALKQMEQDEDFGEMANPDMYSYFEEIIKKPYLREWLEWDDASESFKNEKNLELLYSWITPSEELGGRKKIPMAIDIRRLPSILENPELYAFFIEPQIDINAAAARAQIIETLRRPTEWRDELRRVLEILERIPLGAEFVEEDILLLEKIKNTVSELIKRASKIARLKK